MGFFSSNCHECGHPLLSSYAHEERNSWMGEAVAIRENGSTFIGQYDGYGRIDGIEYANIDSTCYHQACWEKAGKPAGFLGESDSAEDQGFFFNGPEHDLPDPRTVTQREFDEARQKAEDYDPENPPRDCHECGEECDPLEAWQDEFDEVLCEWCAMERKTDEGADA